MTPNPCKRSLHTARGTSLLAHHKWQAGSHRGPFPTAPTVIAYRTGRSATIIVVEIASRAGTRASKEYEAPTLYAAMAEAQRELRRCPDFRLIDIWVKNQRGETLAEVW